MPAKGQTLSPEARAKVSAARKGKPLSAEHRAAISRGQQGRQRVVWCQRPDGRWVVIGRGGRTTLWYRVVVQNEIGRELRSDEIVHHINGDPTDDRVENLELTTHANHAARHQAQGDGYQFSDEDRARAQARLRTRVEAECVVCGTVFERAPSQLRRAARPTCSRVCADLIRTGRPA